MKNIWLLAILLVAALTSLNARSVVEDALLTDTKYTLMGTFGQHDFADVPYAFDWAFTMLSTGKSYQLQGNKPTKDDVFGWKEVSIKAPTPVWFMFRLNGDVDGDGSTKYDWIVASVDTNIAAAYKLAGVSDSGNFKYSSKLNLNYKINNDKIQMYAIGSIVTSESSNVTDVAEEEAVTEVSIVEAAVPVPIEVPDITAPVIVLNGAASMTITQGETFNDPRAKATDDIDGSVKVKIDGVINTQLPGTYTLIYSAIDSAGNKVSIERVIVVTSSKYSYNKEGLVVYAQNILPASYKLNQLTNDEFNALSDAQKLQVADKLLSTLFFGYPLKILEEKISSGSFIDDIQNALNKDTTDRVWLENYITDEEKFIKYRFNKEVPKILSRFYAMNELDSYFLKNWTAYILTQTIMFSPAVELDSSQLSNVDNVYNHFVASLNEEMGMRYITYEYMRSEDNWRRFRSPEDNGREMLEIFLLDFDDSHVPIAAKALQNWKLDRVGYTLTAGSNENTEALQLFDTTIYNGDDFYRELVESNLFTKGVISRLTDFLFPNATQSKRDEIINTIVSSSPETWQDILLQIVFSEEYLLHSSRTKSVEEVFFSLSKKMDFKHFLMTFSNFTISLESMNQASMKYKLGKLDRVPLDTLSFANYHYFIRSRVLLNESNSEYIDNYKSAQRQGWNELFIAYDNFDYDSANVAASLDSLIHYLFKATIARTATIEELQFFQKHMLKDDDKGKKILNRFFNIFVTYDDKEHQKRYREIYKKNIALTVLDYISRLDAIYVQSKVK